MFTDSPTIALWDADPATNSLPWSSTAAPGNELTLFSLIPTFILVVHVKLSFLTLSVVKLLSNPVF